MSIFKSAPAQEVLQKTQKMFVVLILSYFWVSFVLRQLKSTSADQLSGKVIEHSEIMKGYAVITTTLVIFSGYAIESWYKHWRARKNKVQVENL